MECGGKPKDYAHACACAGRDAALDYPTQGRKNRTLTCLIQSGVDAPVCASLRRFALPPHSRLEKRRQETGHAIAQFQRETAPVDFLECDTPGLAAFGFKVKSQLRSQIAVVALQIELEVQS